MDRGLKILMAAGILLGGIMVASLFRHRMPRSAPPLADSYEQLVLRERIAPQVAGQTASDPPTARIGPDPVASHPVGKAGRSGTTLTGMGPGEPPPALARRYPSFREGSGSRWGTSMGLGLPRLDRSDQSPRTHKIVDGDTLGGLAERYLGNADRFLEIYEANRDLLPSPEVLPIGVELRIPPGRIEAASTPDLTSPRPLVPVPAGSAPLHDSPAASGDNGSSGAP